MVNIQPVMVILLMAGRKGAVEIAPQIRGAVMRAFKLVENSKQDRKYAGMSLSEIFADLIHEGQIKDVIDMAGKFTPKEHLIDVDGSITLDTAQLPTAAIREVFSGSGIESGAEGAVVAVQGSDPVEATERPTVRSLPQSS